MAFGALGSGVDGLSKLNVHLRLGVGTRRATLTRVSLRIWYERLSVRMRDIRRIKPTWSASLPKAPAGWFYLDHRVTVDGFAAILMSDAGARSAWREKQELTDVSIAKGRLSLFDGKAESAVIQFALEDAFSAFDCAPNGNWILAKKRCLARELNARLISSHGIHLHRIAIGDGISHVQFDKAGNLWVGYIDEGVFGDNLGSAGVAKFDVDAGKLAYSYNACHQDAVADCYALNAGDDVYFSFYGASKIFSQSSPYATSEKMEHQVAPGVDPNALPKVQWQSGYPIVHIAPSGKTRLWWTPVFGPSAIAADSTHAIFVGGYLPENDHYEPKLCRPDGLIRLILLRFEEEGALALNELILDLGEGHVGKPWRAEGRRDMIHILTDGMWFRLSVADVIRSGA